MHSLQKPTSTNNMAPRNQQRHAVSRWVTYFARDQQSHAQKHEPTDLVAVRAPSFAVHAYVLHLGLRCADPRIGIIVRHCHRHRHLGLRVHGVRKSIQKPTTERTHIASHVTATSTLTAADCVRQANANQLRLMHEQAQVGEPNDVRRKRSTCVCSARRRRRSGSCWRSWSGVARTARGGDGADVPPGGAARGTREAGASGASEGDAVTARRGGGVRQQRNQGVQQQRLPPQCDAEGEKDGSGSQDAHGEGGASICDLKLYL